MVRIGGGVFPEIKERDYLGNGNYRVDAGAGKVRLQIYMPCLYVLSFHCVFLWPHTACAPPSHGLYSAELVPVTAKQPIDQGHLAVPSADHNCKYYN